MTYDRVNWQNEPSENTPISAENLNKMDSAIKELSEMIVANPVEADTDELKKIGIEGTIYKIAGGHELVNSSGSTMTQRSKMEFLDTHLTDDSVNNTTKVQVTKEVTTAQFSSETEEGLYFISDMPDSVVTAEQVAYDSNDSVKDKIDDLYDKNAYHIGDSVMFQASNLMLAGRTGWSGKDFYFGLFLNKPIGSDISSATITFGSGGSVYLISYNQAVYVDDPSGVSSIVTMFTGSNAISLKMSFTTAPLSITDGICNLMVNKQMTITFA